LYLFLYEKFNRLAYYLKKKKTNQRIYTSLESKWIFYFPYRIYDSVNRNQVKIRHIICETKVSYSSEFIS